MEVKLRIGDEAELAAIIDREQKVLTQFSQKRLRAKTFSASIKAPASEPTAGTPSGTFATHTGSSSHTKLQRMPPPKFSGDIRDFARFRSDFEKIVEPEYRDAVHQVYVMKEKCLEGEARDLVRNLDSLSAIWERLNEKYGDTSDIVDSVINDLQECTIQRTNQDEGVVNLIQLLEKGVQDLTSIGKRSEIANAYTVKFITKKLPTRIYRNWLEFEENYNEENSEEEVEEKSTFEKLLIYLKKERKRTEKIMQQSKDRNQDKPNDPKPKKPGKVNMFSGKINNSNNNCMIHNKPHLTRKCSDFLGRSVEERIQLVKDLKACELCLTTSHVGSDCPWLEKWEPCGVNGCQYYHSRLLHPKDTKSSHHIQAAVQVKSDLQVSTEIRKELQARTLLLMQEIPDETGDKIFTFWDYGSGLTLVARAYARKKKLKGIKVSYDLVTVNNEVHPQHTMLYDITIVNRKGKKKTIKAFEIESICDEVAFLDKDIAKLFKNLKIEDVSRPKKQVDLLIGMDQISLHPKQQSLRGNLALFRSLFGTGKVLGGRHKLITGADKMNGFARIVAYGTPRNIRAECMRKCIDFFTAENLGVQVPPMCDECSGCKNCKFEAHELSQEQQKSVENYRKVIAHDPVRERNGKHNICIKKAQKF